MPAYNTMLQVFRAWQAELDLSPRDCSLAWSLLVEQVFWSLWKTGQARLRNLITITIHESRATGVRCRASRFLRRVRKHLYDGNAEDDETWIEKVLHRRLGKGRARVW